MASDALTGGFRAPDYLGSPGSVHLTELDPPRGRSAWTVDAILTKAPIVTAGYGGWARTARPRAKALTEWVGRDSVSLTMEFIIYNEFGGTYGSGIGVAENIRNLEHFLGVDAGDPEPPLVSITSDPKRLVPHNEFHAPHVSWFVESCNWDSDGWINNSVGNPIRAPGTMVVTQCVRGGRLTPASKARGSNKGARRKTYVIKKGDTLHTIAARKDVYGDAKQWKKLAKANHIRDSKALHKKIGKTIKIP